MLDMVAGDASKKPMALLGFCPSPPLKWSNVLVHNLIECAKYNIPIELISMPQQAATAPATVAGTLVQHTAETLSGIVMSQLARKGSPVVYGGSLGSIDMQYGTPAGSTPETELTILGTVEIGKYLGLPTQSYAGYSSSKILDAQSGFHAGMSVLNAVLGKTNLIAFGSPSNLKQLVIDNEICWNAYRIAEGFTVSDETLPSVELFQEAVEKGTFISLKHTLQWFRKEMHMPGKMIDRRPLRIVKKEGKADILDRAKDEVKKILREHRPEPLPGDVKKELEKFMLEIARKHGMDKVPV
jgi:trimethylamine--corrinoid protein Co-methyltransferase